VIGDLRSGDRRIGDRVIDDRVIENSGARRASEFIEAIAPDPPITR
jgi:hypothetical protein